MHVSLTASLHRVLDRLGITFKRGRERVSSPDPDYLRKLQFIFDLLQQAQASEGRIVVLFLDELTYYRQPSLASAYEAKGSAQPLAHRSHRSNTQTRVIGAVDAQTGQVCFWQGAKTDLPRIVRFYGELREAFPRAHRIYAVQDNWPVHFHPDVLVALEEQERPFPFRPSSHWSTEPREAARNRWGGWKLPIQIVPLPTYAPWTNPIEKLWRWGRQEVLHLHRHAEDLETLRERFARFLERFASGSSELLRYIGLSDIGQLYRGARNQLARAPT